MLRKFVIAVIVTFVDDGASAGVQVWVGGRPELKVCLNP